MHSVQTDHAAHTAPAAITLRPARTEDSARCQAIAVAAWVPIYASTRQLLGEAIFGHLFPRWPERKAAQIAAAFERHPEWIVVAVMASTAAGGGASPPAALDGRDDARDPAREQIVGFATYRLDAAAGVGEIGNNAVDPAWHGRGIATALYREVLDRFRTAGMRVARVTTGLDDAHAPARAAYRKVGFRAGVPSVTLYQELEPKD